MKILIPIPHADFDPTEVAVPWSVLTQAGHEVVFATPDGSQGQADALMLTGEGLDVWGWIPGLKKLKLFGLLLRASRRARTCYQALRQDPGFQAPVAYDALVASDYDGLILPGGHAPQMQVFLESEALQGLVASFFVPDERNGEYPNPEAVFLDLDANVILDFFRDVLVYTNVWIASGLYISYYESTLKSHTNQAFLALRKFCISAVLRVLS